MPEDEKNSRIKRAVSFKDRGKYSYFYCILMIIAQKARPIGAKTYSL